MNPGTQIQVAAGLALVHSIVTAASVAAHSQLPAVLDLPLHIGDSAAVRQWNPSAQLVPPMLALPVPGRAQLLPNWELGRNAAMLLPNDEPGTVTFELLNLDTISRVGPLPVAPRAASIDADRP